MHSVWQSYRKAHQVIFRHGYWKYLSIPILLSILMAVGMLVGGYFLALFIVEMLAEHFPSHAPQSDWARWLLILLLMIIEAGPCYVIFRSMVMVLYGPFLDQLSESVEFLITNQTSGESIGLLRSCLRPLLLAICTIAVSLVLFAASLGLGLIPVVGWLVTILLIWPLQLFLSTISCVDPYLERHGVSLRESFRRMWRNKFELVFFGGMTALITLIPVIGWFLGPTYSVVAGLIFSVERLGAPHSPPAGTTM